MKISLSPFPPEHFVSRDGSGHPVPRQSTHFLHTQAESGAYSRDSLRFPWRCLFIYTANRHWVSPEFNRSLSCVPRSHRKKVTQVSLPPSFCGDCLNFSREKHSAVPFPRGPLSRVLRTNNLIVLHLLGIFLFIYLFLVRKTPSHRDTNSRPNVSEGYHRGVFLLLIFPCSADHEERDWPPWKVIFPGWQPIR